MTDDIKTLDRNRPAYHPIPRTCDRCAVTFSGADWHCYCSPCVEIVALEESRFRQRHGHHG